jgi:hypothetical protein
MTTSVTLSQAAHLVKTCGNTNTFVFQGEPGIGKSSMLSMLSGAIGIEPRYIDCALLDLGDLQMPTVEDDSNEEDKNSNEEDKKCVAFVPNKMFVSDKPLLVMLDEIGKAMRPVQNALLTLLLEKRIGNHKLPEGSIVFGTTNLSTDGVGDKMEAHAKNRVTFLKVDKPDSDSWLGWGMDNNIEPAVMAWVKEYPHCLSSYTDGGEADNPYIYYPTKQQAAFVTPRSLAHASHIVQQRESLDDTTLIAALSGTIGESAARDMQAFLKVADSLPPFKVIIEKPDTTPIPDSPIASVILALGAVMRVDTSNINKWMEYLVRLPREVQFLFVQNAMRSKSARVLATAKNFTTWARENSWAV